MTYRPISDVIDRADDPMRTALVSMGGVRGSVAVAFERCTPPVLVRPFDVVAYFHNRVAGDAALASLDVDTYLPLDSASRGIDYWAVGQHLDPHDEFATGFGLYLYDDGRFSLSMSTRYAPESGADVLSASDLLRLVSAASAVVGQGSEDYRVGTHLVVNGGAAGVSLDGESTSPSRARSIPMGHQAAQARLTVPGNDLSSVITASVAGAFGWTPEESATLTTD